MLLVQLELRVCEQRRVSLQLEGYQSCTSEVLTSPSESYAAVQRAGKEILVSITLEGTWIIFFLGGDTVLLLPCWYNSACKSAFYLQHAPTSDAPCKQRYAKASAAPETAKDAAGTRKEPRKRCSDKASSDKDGRDHRARHELLPK